MRVLLFTVFVCFLAAMPGRAQTYFEDYCSDNTGSTDCSQALLSAALDSQEGDVIHLPAGTFLIKELDVRTSGLNLTSFEIKGAGKGRTILLTDKFYPRDVGYVSLEDVTIKGINNTDAGGATQGTALVAAANGQSFQMRNCELNGSAEDLLSVAYMNQFSVSGCEFYKSGRAGRLQPDGIRPRGWAIALAATSGTISGNTMLDIPRGGVFLGTSSDGLTIENNTIDLYLGSSTPRPDGLTVGNGGIYIGQEPTNIKNVTVRNNTIANTHVNGLRINGVNASVTGNTFRNNGTTAVKAHVLNGGLIANNTIRDSNAGILLVSQGVLSGVTVRDNRLYNNGVGVSASIDGNYGGQFDQIHILNNSIMGSDLAGVVLWGSAAAPAPGNSVQGNTISNGNPNTPHANPSYTSKPFIWGGIVMFHNDNVYLDNNWIYGQLMESSTTTWNGQTYWRHNHIYARGGSHGRITRNTVFSPTCRDSAYGGVTLRDTDNFRVDRLNVTNITNPVTEINATNSQIDSETFTASTTSCY